MQPYFADIQKLFTDWYHLTLENPLYPATLAIIVWLLTAIIYNIKIAFIHKKRKSIEATQIELQSKLEYSEQQLAKKQTELSEQLTQLEECQQLNAEFKAKNDERNQNIIDTIKKLATQFDLNEQLVKSDKKIKDEFIWQQQDNIIEQLAERILKEQNEKSNLEIIHQQEIAQLSEKESVIGSLQASLELQTQQFTQIESTLAQQNTLLQQQKEESEQHLNRILEKHRLEVSKLLNDLHQSAVITEKSNPSVTSTQNTDTAITLEKKQADTPPKANNLTIEEEKEKKQEESTEIKPINEPVLTTESAPEKKSIAPEDIIAPIPVIEPSLSEPSPAPVIAPSKIIPDPFMNNDVATTKKQEPFEPDFIAPSRNITGKMKKLFSKSKKEKKVVDTTQAEAPSTPTSKKTPDSLASHENTETLETQSHKPSKNISEKMKGLFNKPKKEPKVTEQTHPEPINNTPTSDTLPSREKTDAFEPDFSAPNFNITGKLKGLLGKKK